MVNAQLIEDLLVVLREDECCIKWLKMRIQLTPSGIKREKMFEDLQLSKAARDSNRKMLDQYYIWGITTEQLLKDIQR